jgi:hypothetical protein
MVRSVGVTAIDSSDAGVTVKEAEPETSMKEAVMVVGPGARAVARP